MKKIHLHGYLGEMFGKEHTLNINNASEAIRAFNANYPNEFLKELRKGEFKILCGNEPFKSYDDLEMNYSDTYHIVPIPTGSKSSFFQVFVGVVLIAAAFYTGGASLAAWGAMSTGMALMGAGLILGSFFSPQIQDYSQTEQPDERPSYLFNGPTNTVEQGGPIPLVYGRVIVGSKVISAELDIEDIS